jgi:outer membrane protein assembly factor BamB
VDNHVYALDASSGELRWRYLTGGRVTSSPAVADGVVYVGSHDNYVYALDASSGELRWRYQTGHNVSSPAVAGGVVYVGSHDDYLYAITIP